jgi:hypothetical protein
MNKQAFKQGFLQRLVQLEKSAEIDPRLLYGGAGMLSGGLAGWLTAPEGRGLRNALIGAGLGGAAGAGYGHFTMPEALPPGFKPAPSVGPVQGPALPSGAFSRKEERDRRPLSARAKLPSRAMVSAMPLPLPLKLALGLGTVQGDMISAYNTIPGRSVQARAERERLAEEPAYRAARGKR